jgi:hypothetical protein
VVARVFVILLVVSVMMLIRFDAEQRVPYFPTVINPAPMVANAVRSGQLMVVYKRLEVAVDVVFHYVFCTLFGSDLRVVRVFPRIATKTVIVVMLPAYAPIDPVLAINAA